MNKIKEIHNINSIKAEAKAKDKIMIKTIKNKKVLMIILMIICSRPVAYRIQIKLRMYVLDANSRVIGQGNVRRKIMYQ